MTSRIAVVSALVAAISVSTLVAVAPSAAAASCGRQTAADGTVGPITCKGDMPNTAVCSDLTKSHATNPMVNGALEWQTANYRWSKSYTTWLTKAIENGTTCTS